jgi:phosphoribosylpyrophosphate synthetase
MRDDSYWAQMGVEGISATNAPNQSQLLGEVRGADVIIIDDIVDSAGQLSMLCRQLHREGAGRIFICASHGLFTGNSTELIDLSPVERVVVTDSIPLPVGCSSKIAQVSIAPLLANIIELERVISDYASRGIEPRRRKEEPQEEEEVYVTDEAE